jgi:hypothetical protein
MARKRVADVLVDTVVAAGASDLVGILDAAMLWPLL